MFHNKKLRIAAVLVILLIGLLVLAGNTVQVRENPFEKIRQCHFRRSSAADRQIRCRKNFM